MNGTWRHRCALTGVAVALLTATGFAAVGDLEYAKSPPAGRGLYVRFNEPAKIEHADKLEQLGAAEAAVAEGTAGGIKVVAAVIRTKAGAKDYEAIRVDLTGKGNFKDAPTMALKTARRTSTLYYATIEPGQATIKKDGLDIPVTVGGYYYESKGKPRMYLRLSAAAEGSCAFGKTTRRVRIIDTTGSLGFGDGAGSRVDAVQVADGEGRFPAVTFSAGTMLGQPVQIARKWYVVKVADMKVSAKPLKAPLGKVAGNGDHWQLVLTGKKYRIIVNGAAKAVPVPADTYRVMRCIYLRPVKGDKATPAVMSYPRSSLEIAEGETANVKMGLPMKAAMSAKVSQGKVTFSVKRTDAAGHRVIGVVNPAGQRPDPPAIDVVDKTGKVVYTAKLEYG